MAEALKNKYGPEVPRKIAAMIAAVSDSFAPEAFVTAVLRDYEELELMPRGRHIARILRDFLPADYAEAVKILLASIGEPLQHTNSFGMGPFLYMPHCHFIAEFGSPLEEYFELSMKAQYELTQRFTAEFSIRPFLINHPERTLKKLHQWVLDPNQHVRRLVSEGTRPRLPWACRLPAFQEDPAPVLELLEKLKDDPEIYVRRSVANNLNDIGKDHPQLLADTCRKWLKNAAPERVRLVKHALRSAIKRGELGALEVLGFAGEPKGVAIENIAILPARARIGGQLQISFTLHNKSREKQALMVDFVIHYVKAKGQSSPRVFKLKSIALDPGESLQFSKKVSLAQMTTRRHYPGTHKIELQLNGFSRELGAFELK